ncbi:hypothetical protein BDY19DRAFT_435433 [Irpex rosettiformis]|uniref:Uncharacterized protein n=1 Tax=Irpex rosettiformis TaxID=378272 RepID=A0ACB8TUP6_9APHY|nr:hypothetical protein BDY19DRAFT_435433 [Irpex rosettiformis]
MICSKVQRVTAWAHSTRETSDIMRSLLAFALPVLSFMLVASTPIQSPIMGAISTPAALTDISGEPFPFSYAASNWCEQGYNNFTVFTSQGAAAPTVADLDDDGIFSGALTSWGIFTLANFGLPPLGTPPPSTLTTPALALGDTTPVQLWLSVVQTFLNCPGNIVQEFGIVSIPVVYSGTASV